MSGPPTGGVPLAQPPGEEERDEPEEDLDEGEVEEHGENPSQKKGKAVKKKAPAVSADNCLACGKKCTARQSSVYCTLCAIWCHKECAAISDAVFKSLQIQMKETGMAWWACRSCLSFSQKINAQFKSMSQRMDGMEDKISRNSEDISKTKREVSNLDREVQRIDEKTDRLQAQIESKIFEEMREREQRRLNLVLHGVKEPSDNVEGNWKRAEEDKDTCVRIFRTVRIRTEKSDIRFCRRVGQKSREPRPMVIGLYTEEERRHILGKAKDLQNSEYSEVNIVPDLTRKQRMEETTMRDEVDQRNKELTKEDREKNLKWLVVGRKGERRIIKGQEREEATSRYTGGNKRRSPAQRGEERSEWRKSGPQRERDEEQRTGARKKEGGAWGRVEREDERTTRRERVDRRERTGESNHRYSTWRGDRRRQDRERTISVESERQHGKRGRTGGSDSDMEWDHQRKKTTRY